jgi:hypothetical protein
MAGKNLDLVREASPLETTGNHPELISQALAILDQPPPIGSCGSRESAVGAIKSQHDNHNIPLHLIRPCHSQSKFHHR